MERFRDEIAGEVLAVRIEPGAGDSAWGGKLNGVPALLDVEKTAT
jgi:hypothetical protein